MQGWTASDGVRLYGLDRWGAGFLSATPEGDVCIGSTEAPTPLNTIIDQLVQQGMGLPILLRFPDVIQNRIDGLAAAFEKATQAHQYKGQYRGVYPIKVNQERCVVEDVIRAGRPHHFGLEAGSKPELLIVLALLDDPEAIIVCNGYKDSEYIETALMAQQLGPTPFLVVEKPDEIELIIDAAVRLGVRPHLGVRARLASRGTGRWKTSSGDRAKFGLDVAQMVSLVEQLDSAGMLDCLKMLHFHIGSQVSDLTPFQEAISEGTRIYVELAKLGAPMGFLDVGGGLGVDYAGHGSNTAHSVTYSLEQYADIVVSTIRSTTDTAKVNHPNIVTEAGRAIVAHHAVLVANVLGVERVGLAGHPELVAQDDPPILENLASILDWLGTDTVQEAWDKAIEFREELTIQFNKGSLDLRQRAVGEELFWCVASSIQDVIEELEPTPESLTHLTELLADTYTTNFSLFQSIPDSWAIGQLFPIMPIHRLHQRPDRNGVLVDLTCDSDGKIDEFVNGKKTLPLHALDGNEYRLGMFLVGAYQEILGDLHNLFGDTHAAHVFLHEDGNFTIDQVEKGDTVNQVLHFVHFDGEALMDRVRDACTSAVNEGRMTTFQHDRLLQFYADGIEGYTYFEPLSPGEGNRE
jgi:arginine decarboxylase